MKKIANASVLDIQVTNFAASASDGEFAAACRDFPVDRERVGLFFVVSR